MRRTKPLHDKGLITDIQMVEIQTKLDQAQAAVTAARRQVEQSTLTAPQNGLITFSGLSVGQHLTPEVPAMTLLDMSAFTVLIHVPEAEVAALHVGDSATLAIPAIHADHLAARLTQIGVQANSLTHTYPVEAYIITPPADVLPGMVRDADRVGRGAEEVVGGAVDNDGVHTHGGYNIVEAVGAES